MSKEHTLNRSIKRLFRKSPTLSFLLRKELTVTYSCYFFKMTLGTDLTATGLEPRTT